MEIKSVYMVWEQRLNIIDSIWEKRSDAASKADTLNIHKGPIALEDVPQWVVTVWRVQ